MCRPYQEHLGSDVSLIHIGVDTDLLREWMCECLAEHQHLCDNPLKLVEISLAWLIDTTDNCIIDGHGVKDYVALSYRWGYAANHLQNELGILDTLQLPGVLLQLRFANRVSPRLKQAFGLTRVLEERDLWADALQREANESTTATNGGGIYASAKLTIVSIDGDANQGIPGLKGIYHPRELSQLKFPLGKSDLVLIRQNPVLSNTGPWSLYFERAWTFQEYLLSKRPRIIGNNQFHWACSSTTHHEDMHGADELSHEEIQRFIIQQQGSHFPEDALAGISGFIYGLAEICFDSALMWTGPEWFSVQVQRRIHSGTDHTTLQESRLPSWSWLGWKGLLELYKSYQHPITKRITQFYSQETPTSSTKHAIQSTFLDHHCDYRNDQSEILLPKGWAKESYNTTKHIRSADEHLGPVFVLGDYVYKHPSLPGRLFWRPFVVKDVRGDSKASMPPQHPFISRDTKRGWFGAQKFSDHVSVWQNFDAQVLVMGKNQECCGCLQLPSDEHAADFPAAYLDNSRTIELVAICLRRMPEFNMDTDTIVWHPAFFDVYGVLWIEWIN
ncbi:heterokaryon incompatibility protein-domain-containing protein [Apiospora phragmitis]|uniref:Heterokaryon incompatibility protein-domain-containing protein n=1 Tax=Apiospora phragmitis TaxID=2905665 RepID=A0ABR1VZF3_9PEZI